MNVLVLVGSLRAGSTNQQLADAAIAHLPSGVDGTVFARLADLPHYSEDLDHDDALPQVARDLREAVADADALLLVTPEYNGSMSSAVKNAVDWASRPRGAAAIVGKPAAVIARTVLSVRVVSIGRRREPASLSRRRPARSSGCAPRPRGRAGSPSRGGGTGARS